jgi:hypothetical protein
VLLVSLLYAAWRITARHERAAPRLPAETLRIATLTTASGETLTWQKAVQGQLCRGAGIDRERETIRLYEQNVRPAIDELRAKGFAAIYVNRNGYPDRGKGVADVLAKLGYTDVIESPAGDLMAVVLRKAG